MSPRCLALVLIAASSAFLSKAQDRGNFIPAKFVSVPHKASFNKLVSVSKNDSVPCYCSVSPEIVSLSGTNTNRTYFGKPNAFCMPIQTTPGGAPGLSVSETLGFDSCKVASVTYAWSITAGNNIASINGSTTNSNVNVLITASGSFTLQLTVTATCSDGSTCTASTTRSETVTVETKRCACQTAPVTITSTGKQGTTWTYSGTAPGTCGGQWGTEPNFQSCNVLNVTYEWSIVGNNVAALSGPANGQTVSVSITGNGAFELRLQITTVCNDEQQCTNYNTLTDNAQLPSPKSCLCNVSVKCERGADAGELRTYNGTLKDGCSGQFGPSPPYQSCINKNIVWSWTVSAGSSVAEIAGPSDQQSVNVRMKGTGAFRLTVVLKVECSDGQKCEDQNYCDDNVSNEKICNLKADEKIEPLMDGGLRPRYATSTRIERDGYIVLGADGQDFDKVVFDCIPSSDCNETGSSRTLVLNSRVRFTWTVTGGEGSFVSLGALPDNLTSDMGDHVIFKPPYVPPPEGNNNESSKTTTVLLLIIDDNGDTQPQDETLEKKITIVTRRFKASPDHYTVDVQGPTFKPGKAPDGAFRNGACKISTPEWKLKPNLEQPKIQVADVPDKDKLVVGEWVVLFAEDQRDPDELTMKCVSAGCTSPPPFKKTYEDNVAWEWELAPGNTGKFVSEPTGRYVVYEAPEKIPGKADMMEVKVRVNVKNPDGSKLDDTPTPPAGEITLKIFRAGVRLDFPALEWLPKEDDEVEVKSKLVYREDGVWKPALAHQARIHFFELLDVSKERGVCLNDPVHNKADECRDLYIGNAKGHERYPDNATTCGGTQLFEKARTAKPEKEYGINVRSRDFGAYGFLTSDAALGNKPNYESVPVNYADWKHPTRANAKTKDYKDNRVSIPRDVDDNHIADNGWNSVGGVHVPDPQDPEEDKDSEPVGDGTRDNKGTLVGDGFTAYEEYRGFKTVVPVSDQGPAESHVRTNIDRKDLFVKVDAGLSFNLFQTASGLVVHEITAAQYDDQRVVNFNFTKGPRVVPQKGLNLIRAKTNGGLLGRVLPIVAPPNWVATVTIYLDKIQEFCQRHKLNLADKLAQVTAHELGHACNVYHHGEGNEEDPKTFDLVHGLRSGDVDCVMRYDNAFEVPNPNSPPPAETIGTTFCTSAKGTGYNANGLRFGDANDKFCRGDCLHQIRVAGHPAKFKTRGDAKCKNQ